MIDEPISISILIIGTIINVFFSWQFSIKAKRYHGVYRFFSFEGIIVLALLNAHVWFADLWRWNQIVSWFLMTLSLALAIHGFALLRLVGKPQGQLENTTTLIRTGAYRYIRHPLYASLIWLGTGIFFKEITAATTVCACINIAALVATAVTEEREMLQRFGDEYAAYMRTTTRFVPFVF